MMEKLFYFVPSPREYYFVLSKYLFRSLAIVFRSLAIVFRSFAIVFNSLTIVLRSLAIKKIIYRCPFGELNWSPRGGMGVTITLFRSLAIILRSLAIIRPLLYVVSHLPLDDASVSVTKNMLCKEHVYL